MYLIYLYILFNDGRIEKHIVKRFSDLSQEKSQYYYYEEFSDLKGKGKTFYRDEIKCFEVLPYESLKWDEKLEVEND